MIFFRSLALTIGLIITSCVDASPLINPVFSPYADVALKKHWDINHNIKSYHLAFINDSGHCKPAWGGKSVYSIQKHWGKHQIEQLKSEGIILTISFGGEKGKDLSHYCDVNQLVTAYENIIDLYQVDSLDFDIENGTANVPRLINALTLLQQKRSNIQLTFTLPVLPEGLRTEGKSIVLAAKNAHLKFHVNIMTMSYGPYYNGDMGDYAVQAATNLHHYLAELYQQPPQDLWKLIEITPLIGVNDGNTKPFTLQNADQLKRFALTNQLGRLSMWSINRDKPCAKKKISPICSGKNLQTHDYEFSEHLQ